MLDHAGVDSFVWSRAGAAWHVASIAASSNLRITRAGSPAIGETAMLARELNCEPVDDLRRGLMSMTSHGFVWFSNAVSTLGEDDGAILEEIERAHANSVVMASHTPVSDDVATSLVGGLWPVAIVPRFRFSEAYQSSADELSALAKIHCATIVCTTPSCELDACSLLARTLDAFDALLAILGEPELVEASLSTSTMPRSTADGLAWWRAASGSLTAQLRFVDQRSALVLASDVAPMWVRELRIFADGSEGSHEQNAPVDSTRTQSRSASHFLKSSQPVMLTIEDRHKPSSSADAARFVTEETARGINRLLHRRDRPMLADEHSSLISMLGAAMLSIKTGEGQSPAKYRRMLGEYDH
jgi:hypothetical protein